MVMSQSLIAPRSLHGRRHLLPYRSPFLVSDNFDELPVNGHTAEREPGASSLAGGEPKPSPSSASSRRRLPWGQLLRRVLSVDALSRPRARAASRERSVPMIVLAFHRSGGGGEDPSEPGPAGLRARALRSERLGTGSGVSLWRRTWAVAMAATGREMGCRRSGIPIRPPP